MNNFNKIITGVSYYPEHWDRENWEADLKDMADMGLSVIRIAESAWADMEPHDGIFNFSWLDEFINLATIHNFKFVLGTPTWAAPVWLEKSHPQIFRVNADGKRAGEGRPYCCRSNIFRFYSQRIALEMARHFRNNTRVIGWQIDNEICAKQCYCPDCRRGFKTWLEKRYKTTDELNKAWGTKFRSRRYNSFEEIDPPSLEDGSVLTCNVLDYYRFLSWSTIEFLDMQAEILRKYCKSQFITHNFLALHHELNFYEAVKKLDVAACDVYPNVDDDYINIFKGHDLCRSSKHDNFWILEQKNGYINYSDYNLAIKPGLVRAWTWLDAARGANAVVYYRYRSNRWGAEQNPNGIIRHDGSRRRAWYEIQQFNKEIAPLADTLAMTKVSAPAAIIHSYDDIWAGLAKNQYINYDCHKLEDEYYRAFLTMGVGTDIVNPLDDLSQYKIVAAPNLMLVSEEMAENFSAYVKAGGIMIFGIRSGQRDLDNAMSEKTWPSLLRELCGVTIDEFEAFPDHGAGIKVIYNSLEYPVKWWADIIRVDTAKAEALYTEKFYKGMAAITSKKFGKGRAVYSGAAGCGSLIADYLRVLLEEAGIRTLNLPENVFITERINEKDSFTFILNMGEERQEFDPGVRGKDILGGKEITGRITVEPLEVLLIRKEEF